LIEELKSLKAKHGDLVVIAQDEEGKYEIKEAYQSECIIYDGRKEGPYDTQLAIRLC
jgi:hypothetical protein